MEFEFSKDEELWQWAVKDFAERELGTQELATLDHIPRDILKKMGDLGFFSLRVPEEYGGNPATWVMIGMLAEEIAKTSIAIAHAIMVSYEVSLPLATYGTDRAKDEWLSGLTKGNKLGCIALTEAGGGSDVNETRTIAIRDQDGYLIRGEKMPVSFGTQGDVGLLFAKTNPDIGIGGLTALLVPLGLPGIRKSEIKTMGLFPSAPCSFTFDGVRVPAEYRIGKEGEGFPIHAGMGLFSDFNQIISGLIALGAAQTAMKLAVSYSKERVAFGEPIASRQAIAFMLAEMAIEVDAARLMTWEAAWKLDKKEEATKDASLAKAYTDDMVLMVTDRAVQILGGHGYIREHPVELYLRNGRGFATFDGMAIV